jgi:hypothetical protein
MPLETVITVSAAAIKYGLGATREAGYDLRICDKIRLTFMSVIPYAA